MKTNIADVYEKNIGSKYDTMGDQMFLRNFTRKEQLMWHFTFCLLKDRWPVEEYDMANIAFDADIQTYHRLFLNKDTKNSLFTLEEWADYMKKMS